METIKLTSEQHDTLAKKGADAVLALDPQSNMEYVLVPVKAYERLTQLAYDDSPWTDAEHDALAAEVDEMLDDDMGIEDPEP